MAVRDSGVDLAGATGEQDLERPTRGTVDAQMAAEAVTGSAGDQAECRRAADQRRGDFVQRAVAADGDDEIATLGLCALGQFAGMARAFGQLDAGRVTTGERADFVEGPGGPFRTEIDDEADFQRGETLTREYSDGTDETTKRSMAPTIHILAGPTAVGKTEWALRWAERRGAEIISCDSLLFYRGMDIGTAKPTADERARVPHHLIDVCDVTEQMDITRYVALARGAVKEILGRGRGVLVTGGSGFYLKAFFGPVADEVQVSAEVRESVARLSLSDALIQLRGLNPRGLGTLDVANPRRVRRALERCLASGRTLVELAADFSRQPGPFAEFAVKFARLDRSPDELARRIDARVANMLRAGLVDEVRRLRAAGIERSASAARAIGYREVIDMLDGRLPENKLATEIATHTRALVKKQRTWFRTQLPPHRVVMADTLVAEGELFELP